MKQFFTIVILFIVATSCKNGNENAEEMDNIDSEVSEAAEKLERERDSIKKNISINPISHATAVITWDEAVIYTDPVGGAQAFDGREKPNLVLITDIHGDHMSAETLQGLDLENTTIIVPQAVRDELPEEINGNFVVLNNDETESVMGFTVEAVPMYNLPPDDPNGRHIKGRGNGYVLEKNGTRLYISGDTEDIPEMRNLENIDIALVCMNMPYTMTVEHAAEGVLAFEPEQVYPYHYRGEDGFADVEKFKSLVNEGNDEIEVVLLDWYSDGTQE